MPPNTRIVDIQERDRCTFPRSEIFDSDGRSLIFPETRELNAVDIVDTPDGARLMALGLIGYLPLTKDITLNITPKFPIGNLWTMLEIAGESYDHILPTIRGYQTSSTRAPIEMLARCFCHFLEGIISVGFERSYYRRQRSGFFRPRIEFGSTMSRYLSRGNPIDTVSTVFEFGLDNPINRIVKAACIRFSRLLPPSNDWLQERRLIQLALDTLQQVREQEPTTTDFNLDKSASQRLRENYSGLLRVYHLLLTGGGIAFTFEPSGKELPSFLFNLDDVFERFIRRTFSKELQNHDISVLDGNKHPGQLFVDNRTYPTKPDLVFRCAKRQVIGLGEVKYKPKLKEADRYQIISHVTAARAPLGILFTPANDGESQRLERIGQLATTANLYHYRVDIYGDLLAAQTQMVRDVMTLFSPTETVPHPDRVAD